MAEIVKGYAFKNKELSPKHKQFILDEAQSLGFPEDIIESATYERAGNILYFGQNYLALLKLLAFNLDMGVMEFKDFRFTLFDTAMVIRRQKVWRDAIFQLGGAGSERDIGKKWSMNLNDFHAIKIEQIVPTKKTKTTLDEYAEEYHELLLHKDLPLISGCSVDWVIEKNGNVIREGSSNYTPNYNLTDLTRRHGAANHLIGTLVTRTKVAAHNHAFGNSHQYLMKLGKLKKYFEHEEDTTIIDATPQIETKETELVTPMENKTTRLIELKKQKEQEEQDRRDIEELFRRQHDYTAQEVAGDIKNLSLRKAGS